MMDGRSLHDKNRDQSIIDHLFLPHHLPSSKEDDFLLKSNHQNEYELLEYLLTFLNSFPNQIDIDGIFNDLKKCLRRWVEIQNPKNVSSSNFQISLQRLTQGDYLPLYFHSQNAAILIEIDEKGPSKPLVSAWQVLLPNETITSSIHRHFSCFPSPKFRLNDTTFLHSTIHGELLTEFYKNPIEYDKTKKSSHYFDETRDVPLSHYVCQWWIMQLKGEQEKKTEYEFKKKHRDHIRFNRAFAPFRRSGLWMTIKVVFQTILMKQWKCHGQIIYKLLITSLLTYIVDQQKISSIDQSLFCVRKILRRLNKIDAILIQLDNSDSMMKSIEFLRNDIQAKLDRILTRFDPNNSVIMKTEVVDIPIDLNSIKVYQHACLLSNLKSDNRQNLSTTGLFPSTTCGTYSSSDTPDTSIVEKETAIELKLQSWDHGWKSPQDFLILLQQFEAYHRVALKLYCSNSLVDPLGYSRFILIALSVLLTMHKHLCSDEKFRRLQEHSIVIPGLFELFEYLLLPSQMQMDRVRFLYDYFNEYKNRSYPDLLQNITSASSFGVHYASQCSTMQTTLKEIRDEVERDKQVKIQEFEKAQNRYKKLQDEAEQLECECGKFSSYRKCDKCSKIREAEQISISIYECPIPDNEEEALAVVFELQMPLAIRCYREMLFQFINRHEPDSSESNVHQWLHVSPHGEKLRRCYSSAISNPKVKLISSNKSISQTHYSRQRKIASIDVDDLIFSNSLLVQISSTRPTSIENERQLLTPKLTESKYQNLQDTLRNTEFKQNMVIAQLSTCSRELRLNQYIEFGSFRSGHCLQWWNLLATLELESLSFNDESVIILIQHALWQMGPMKFDRKSSSVPSWCPSSHQIIRNDSFVDELLIRLHNRLTDCEHNWQNTFTLQLIVIITMRVATLCQTTRIRELMRLIQRCRQITRKWIDDIENHIHIPTENRTDQNSELREKIANIALIALFTYFIDCDRIRCVLFFNDDVLELLRYLTTFQDHLILTKNSNRKSPLITNLMRIREYFFIAMQPYLKCLLEKQEFQILKDFTHRRWKSFTRETTTTRIPIVWKKRAHNIYDGWYDGQYQSTKISINTINGTFLIDQMTVGFLPSRITSSDVFRRVFGEHIFEVQPSEIKDTYITKYKSHGEREIQYLFSLNEKTSSIDIYEIHGRTGDRYQLVPLKYFQDILADIFISNFSHWRDIRRQLIHFRPISFKEKDFLDRHPYLFDMKTGQLWTTEESPQKVLISRSSTFFEHFYQKYFSRLDDRPYIYMFREKVSIKDKYHSRVYIHLSRLRISFIYESENQIFRSNEYADMCIDSNQQFGTLCGLEQGLLLRPMSNSAPEKMNYKCRKLLVPYGQILKKDERILVERKELTDKYFVFSLNDRLRILQSDDSPTGWLYLALLHAFTSTPLVDRFTGMTGMERSFQLLNSAACWTDQPYDEISLKILQQIARLSPKAKYYPDHLKAMEQIEWNQSGLTHSLQNFGYYLIVKQMIETSYQMKFMHSNVDKPVDISNSDYNEELLTKLYWNYRDFSNPIARLSPQLEEKIKRRVSPDSYQPTRTWGSTTRFTNSIQFINSYYQRGNVSLDRLRHCECFPLKQWVEKTTLKTIWISLLEHISKIPDDNTPQTSLKRQQYELLIEFLHYVCGDNQTDTYHLQMLKTASYTTISDLKDLEFPRESNYKNVEKTTFDNVWLLLPSHLSSDETEIATKEIMNSFKNGQDYRNTRLPKRPISQRKINELFRTCRANTKLKEFIEDVWSCFSSVWLLPLKRKTSFVFPRFLVESFDEHFQIRTDLKNVSIEKNLLENSRRKFSSKRSKDLIEPVLCQRLMRKSEKFPEEIFSSNSSDEIQRYFKEQLTNSWNQFQSNDDFHREYPSINEIQRIRQQLRNESEQWWNELIKSMDSSDRFVGLTVRLLPTTLISLLYQRWLKKIDSTLNDEQYDLLGGLLVCWVEEQQIERALDFAQQKQFDEFQRELSNTPHTNWIPSIDVPWLIMELEMNMTIRRIQIDVARHMMKPSIDSDQRNIVMQMNMGEGKTSVIIPMLTLSLSSPSSSLVRVIILKSLLETNYQSLRSKLGGLLNRRVLTLSCNRTMNFNEQQIQTISERLEQSLANGDVLLSAPEDILSFDLLIIDKCRLNEISLGEKMLNLQRWYQKYIRDLLDESDEILHVKYQLVYTVGNQQQIDGNVERWTTIQLVLAILKEHIDELINEFPNAILYKSATRPSRFPRIRLLSNQSYERLCEMIAKNWLEQKNLTKIQRETLLKFLLDSSISFDFLQDENLSTTTIQLLLIVRGLLSAEVLLIALKKRYRVNYGVTHDSSFNRLMAVPFRAKDVAADRTEFGHIDVAILLTQLSYYYSGLNNEQLFKCLKHLVEKEKDPQTIYDQWILMENSSEIDPTTRHWNNINLNDLSKISKYLFPMLCFNTSVIDYFLNHFVYPIEAKQFPWKLVSSPWDLTSPPRSHIITGFSGTNDTQLLLPVHISQCDLTELRQTDAIVLNNLLRSENEHYQVLPMNFTSTSILEQMLQHEPMIQVIIDVGALFVSGTNEEIAKRWLIMSNQQRIDYVIYFQSNIIMVCDRQNNRHRFATSPANERLDRCLVYLDEIHTRGIDFKFPPNFHAALTLGMALTKDRFVQAAMRMRKLGHGHSLSFWSSNEVHQQICRTENRVQLIDILRWVYQNTEQATWNGFHHWATQSLSYQRKFNAYQLLQSSSSSDTMKIFAEQALEPETILLKNLYGPSKQQQTVLSIYLSRYQTSNIQLSSTIHEKVSQQLERYSGSRTRLAQLLDEEQEKEIEQELEPEQERQYESPPSAIPAIPVWHDEILQLCRQVDSPIHLDNYPNIFRRLSHAFDNTQCLKNWPANSYDEDLWMTTEFQRVIETEGEYLDIFLRPSRWILFYNKNQMILLSPFEANRVMEYFYDCQNDQTVSPSTLHLLLPRTQPKQSVFIHTSSLIMPSKVDVNIPLKNLVQLFVFNGTLYFDSADEQTAYCEYLGLCPKDRTAEDQYAFDIGFIDMDGFIINDPHRRRRMPSSRFKVNPIELVRKLLEIRHHGHPPMISHVGSIIYNGTKSFK